MTDGCSHAYAEFAHILIYRGMYSKLVSNTVWTAAVRREGRPILNLARRGSPDPGLLCELTCMTNKMGIAS